MHSNVFVIMFFFCRCERQGRGQYDKMHSETSNMISTGYWLKYGEIFDSQFVEGRVELDAKEMQSVIEK